MKGAPDNESKNLLLAQIEHKTFEQLEDIAQTSEMSVPLLIEKTRVLSAAADADWE